MKRTVCICNMYFTQMQTKDLPQRWHNPSIFSGISKGSRKKIVLLVMAGPLRPNPPNPLELNGR